MGDNTENNQTVTEEEILEHGDWIIEQIRDYLGKFSTPLYIPLLSR